MEEKIPSHLGIIMDGNGRWAEKRGLARSRGHEAGADRVVDIVKECSHSGVEALSLYAFSTENWKRPEAEVGAIMTLLIRFIRSYLAELNENRVRIVTMGDLSRLPLGSRQAVDYAKSFTADNQGMVLNIGLNYGGRDEIVRAVRSYLKEGEAATLDEAAISAHLDTAGLPPLDLVVRTGGELRLSNFMIWQAAYAEFIFRDTLWPDYSEELLHSDFAEFARRQRRFGGIE